jgi:hypothetical protein
LFEDNGLLKFDFSDVVFCPWDHPEHALRDELHQLPWNNHGVQARYPAQGLGDLHGKEQIKPNLYIWAHGDTGHLIGDGGRETLNAHQLARLLERRGLSRKYRGNIILWSCWAGVSCGMASALSSQLCHLKYAVPVWGTRYATSVMCHRQLYVLKNVELGGPLPAGKDAAERLINGGAQATYSHDMVCYRPAYRAYVADAGSTSGSSASSSPGGKPASPWTSASVRGSTSGSTSASTSGFGGAHRK